LRSSGEVLPAGTRIDLLPAGADGSAAPETVVARVIAAEHDAGVGHLTVEVATRPAVGWLFDEERIWISGRVEETGELVVLEATGVSDTGDPQDSGQLQLLGITTLAREPRRAAVRAPLNAMVEMSSALDGVLAETTTVDLSRSGCRLRMEHSDASPAVGERLHVAMDLAGHRVGAAATVARREGPEVCLKFAALDDADTTLSERFVYDALSTRHEAV
jgi:hypothetical protein